MEKPHFVFYKRPNDDVEFIDFLEALPLKDKLKLLAVIKNTEEQGLAIATRMQWIKKLDTNLYELRSKTGSNIQRALYFHVVNNTFVITHGFSKKTNKTPQGQITHAKDLRFEFFKNYKE